MAAAKIAVRQYVYVSGSKYEILFDDVLLLTPGVSGNEIKCASRRDDTGMIQLNEQFAISNTDLKELIAYNDLEQVDLGVTELTDAAVPEFAKFTKLKRLLFTSLAVTDKGLNSLQQCKQLESLSLWLSKNVSDKAIQDLRDALPQTQVHIYREQ